MIRKVSCDLATLLLVDGSYDRFRYRPRPVRTPEGERRTCGDCGTPAGGLHHPGCDMEGCPRRRARSY